MLHALLAWALLAALPSASAVERQFSRLAPGHADNMAFTVKVQPEISGTCMSYWGANGKNWATLILSQQLLQQLAAEGRSGADALLTNTSSDLDDWGCIHIKDANGHALELLFDLIESGSVKVIDDTSGTAVSSIIARYPNDKPERSTYHLHAAADAFLTRRPINIQRDIDSEEEHKQPRKPWQIETIKLTAKNRKVVEFAKAFFASCSNKDIAQQGFYRQHTRLPLPVRYNMVGQDGVEVSDDKISYLASTPLCAGSSEPEELELTLNATGFSLSTTYSHSGETMHFQRWKSQWRLVQLEVYGD